MQTKKMESESEKNPVTINELFDQKYGEKGTKSRDNFEQKAEAYLIAELVKESRKKANLTQEQLANKLNVKRASSDIRMSTLRKIIETGLGGKLHVSVEFI
jgi:HTH-type transcriptional regulator/antitoxin HipB